VLSAAAVAAPSDEELACSLSEGSSCAFDALVRKYHRRVFGICYRMSGSAQESEDLVQETFLRVFRHRSTYQPGRRFVAWLDRICINVCLTHRERSRRQGPLTSLELDDTRRPATVVAGSMNQDPEARAGVSELIDSVHRITKTLSPPYRAALILRVFADLSYQEIAVALGCSIGTVMSRLNRARIALRNQLKDPS
jgi:RNA polymerase sigma-70 factor (ECF subfamily)